MKTIVEPKEHIAKLWGKQQVKDHVTYRMMRYVMRTEQDDKTLLHNVVTGQLVVLDPEEVELIKHLPNKYSELMAQLVLDHYIVPDDYDEHQQVVNMRKILRLLASSRERNGIRNYTILPTTSCNARCYYCFEHGVKNVTMTKEIAEMVVEFISTHCEQDKKAAIMWFGGEPTVAANRIDEISAGLKAKGIAYTSTMISNAYLFDEIMVEKAKTLWNLKRVQISIDGKEERYNEVKNFVNAHDNPFKRVMRNIEMLLESGIRVDLRMNYDLDNCLDFEELVPYMAERFKGYKGFQFYAYPVIGEYPDKNGVVRHGNDDWRKSKTVELNNIAREAGVYHPQWELPFLNYKGCGADADDAVTINAQGMLVECPEHFEEAQSVGNLKDGIANHHLVLDWKKIADYDSCKDCTFFPRCVRLVNCSAKDKCYFQDRNQQFYESVKRHFIENEMQ